MRGPKGVCVVLFDESGRVGLQLRDGNCPDFPHQWALFGGKMEDGESPENAIHREMVEELNLDLPAFTELGRYSFRETEIFAFASICDPSKIVLNEGAGFAFFRTTDALKLKLGFNAKEVLLDFVSKSGIQSLE